MKFSSLFVLIAITILFIFSCNKKNEPEPVAKTTITKSWYEMFTDAKWQLEDKYEMHLNGKDTSYVNTYSTWDSVLRDDFLVFGTNGKVYWNQNITKTPYNMPDIDSTDTWWFPFADDSTYFKWKGGLSTDLEQIYSLTDKRMVMNIQSIFNNEDSVLLINVYKNIK